MDSEGYVASWLLSLHDKADSTRRLYAEELRRFDKWLGENRSLVDATRRDAQTYLAN